MEDFHRGNSGNDRKKFSRNPQGGREDRPGNDRNRREDDNRNNDHSGGYQRRDDRPRSDSDRNYGPRSNDRRDNRGPGRGDDRREGGYRGPRPQGDRPYGDRSNDNRSRGDRPYGDRPQGDRPYGDRPRGERPYGDRPGGDRPHRPYGEDRGNRGDRPYNKPYGDRPPRPYGAREERPSDRPDYAKNHGTRKLRPRKTKAEQPLESGEMRLNKYLSNAGICSRREADQLITAGLVEVNGETITTLGHRVQPGDTVKYNGSLVRLEKKVYLLLNKPKGFITTVDDPKARKTVMELIHGACRERVYPVGRLDRKTTGVLLFTNDGELAEKMLHPSQGAKKIYQVTLDKPLSVADKDLIAKGVVLEDGLAPVDEIAYVEDKPRNQVGLVLHLGRNRIVRRIFAQLGYEVVKLDRAYFAGLTKKGLQRGQYRFLNPLEIQNLKNQ